MGGINNPKQSEINNFTNQSCWLMSFMDQLDKVYERNTNLNTLVILFLIRAEAGNNCLSKNYVDIKTSTHPHKSSSTSSHQARYLPLTKISLIWVLLDTDNTQTTHIRT